MRLALTLAVLSCAVGAAGAVSLLDEPLEGALRSAATLPLPVADGAAPLLLASAADVPAAALPSIPLLPDDLVLVDLRAAAPDAPVTEAVLLREAAPAPAPRAARSPLEAKAERLDAEQPPAPSPSVPARRAFAPPADGAAAPDAQVARAYAPPYEPSGPARAAATGAVAGGVLLLLGLGLYHRIRPNAALENETRKAIFDAVCQRPGLGVHAIAQAAGVSYSTATYHLERLVAVGMLVMTPDGNKLCYYKNGGAFTETERKILPILKNEEASKLLDAILDTPGTYRAALAERLGVTATTINWHLKRLRDAGLVRELRQGRNAYLYVDVQAMRASMAPLAQKVGATDPVVQARLSRYAGSIPGPASS